MESELEVINRFISTYNEFNQNNIGCTYNKDN